MSIRRIFNLALEKHTCAIAYRYGFNTQERDDEIAGFGNIMTAEYWEYDTRLGRRWNLDPAFKLFPWQSPYLTFDDNPILKNDPNGDAPPNNTVIQNTINSITKSKDSYTVSETTIVSKTVTNEIVNADGTRTVETIFTQTKIISITTISNTGKILENNSESTTYSRSETNTYYDLGVASFYKAFGYEQNIMKETYKKRSDGQFVGPIAKVVQLSLTHGFSFPIKDDMLSVKSLEDKSEWMGDKYINSRGKRVAEPGLKYYKKGHDIQLEIFNKDKFEMKKNKQPNKLTFIRENDYYLYKIILKNTQEIMH